MDHTTTAIDSALLTEMTIALLDGAFETPPWRSFHDQLRRATDADFATLVFHPPGWPYNDGSISFRVRRRPPIPTRSRAAIGWSTNRCGAKRQRKAGPIRSLKSSGSMQAPTSRFSTN